MSRGCTWRWSSQRESRHLLNGLAAEPMSGCAIRGTVGRKGIDGSTLVRYPMEVVCRKPTTLNPMSDNKPPGAEKKIAAGICGILLGALGIHKFILGYTTQGIIMLLVTVLTLGMAGFIMGIIGLIEGILYLTKSDEDFSRTYIQNKKAWF
jgi:TM2 domain-containing membrane protein YozV